MCQVYVRVSTLEKLILEMKHRQLDVACVSIIEGEPEEGFPPSLSIEGVNSVHPSVVVDLDGPDSDESLSVLFSSASTNLI